MLKRRIAVVSIAALVASPLLTATAADIVRVDGDHFSKAGLKQVVQGCSDPISNPQKKPRFVIRRGPGHVPYGERSIGWRMRGSTYGAGIWTRIASPSTLDSLQVDVNGPADAVQGAAVVRYFAPHDKGVWRGTADLGADTTSGWHTVDALSATYAWQHYTKGRFDNRAPSSTLPVFVSGQGGDGGGADVGLIFGCDGNPFYLDGFEVGSSGDSRIYDLDGYATRVKLGVGKRSPKSVTITAGHRVRLWAKLFAKVDKARMAGRITFRKGAHKKAFAHDRTTRRAVATASSRPKTATAYWATYSGTGSYVGSTSRTLKVRVRFAVGASFADNMVRKGSRIAVSGRVRPGKATTVRLQRLVDRHWRTVKSGTSGAEGNYRIAADAPGVGKSYYRVLAEGVSGNVDGHSHKLLLTVTAPPPPSGGGDGGGGGDDPPPPPGPEGIAGGR